MNEPQETRSNSPVAVDLINQLPGVECHFQADKDIVKTYASNDEAELLADLSTVCLNFASTVAEAAGFGAVNRVVSYGKTTKFTVFGLMAKNANPPGPRIFGIKTSKSVKEKDLVSAVNNLI